MRRAKSWLAAPVVLVAAGVAARGVVEVFAPGPNRLPVVALLVTADDIVVQSQQLDVDLVDARRELETRHAVAADLAAGRITLAAAADAFLAMNEAHPGHLTLLRRTQAGDTDRERSARQVIAFVQNGDGPAADAAAGRQLGADFAVLFPGAAPLAP